MEWRRKDACVHLAAASLRIEEQEALEKPNICCGTDAAVEVLEIRAAAKSHMLAVVDVLTTGESVRGGSAAEEGALFEQAYAPAGLSQRDAGG